MAGISLYLTLINSFGSLKLFYGCRSRCQEVIQIFQSLVYSWRPCHLYHYLPCFYLMKKKRLTLLRFQSNMMCFLECVPTKLCIHKTYMLIMFIAHTAHVCILAHFPTHVQCAYFSRQTLFIPSSKLVSIQSSKRNVCYFLRIFSSGL